MREQLRQEVLRRFAGAPDTQQARDLRDEILSNTLQRYDDLLAGGKSEQEAYASALESVGDVEELLSSLPRAAQAEPVREAQPKAEAPEKEPHSQQKKNHLDSGIIHFVKKSNRPRLSMNF